MILSPVISSFPIELSLGTIVLWLEITGECDFYSWGRVSQNTLGSISLGLCNRINLNNPKTKIRQLNEILRLSQRLTFQPPSRHLSWDSTIAPSKCTLNASTPFPPWLQFSVLGFGSSLPPELSESTLCSSLVWSFVHSVTRWFFKSTRLCMSSPQLCNFSAFWLFLG